MIPLRVIMEGDDAFKEEVERAGGEFEGGMLDAITLLERGMTSGKPSVAVLVKLNGDGPPIIAETSWALLHAAVRAFEARYGVPS